MAVFSTSKYVYQSLGKGHFYEKANTVLQSEGAPTESTGKLAGPWEKPLGSPGSPRYRRLPPPTQNCA